MTRCRVNTPRKLLPLPANLRLPRRVALAAVSLAFVAAACGSDPGPTAHPDEVVRKAPDITLATKTADVVGAAPGVTATGTVAFDTGADKLVAEPPPKTAPPFGVMEPGAVLDLLRGVVKVTAYGGAEVQGVGTKRYEVDIDLDKAIAATPEVRRADLHELDGKLGKVQELWADVFVDSKGLVRRVLLPVHTDMIRPFGDDKRIPDLVSVDYFNFGGVS